MKLIKKKKVKGVIGLALSEMSSLQLTWFDENNL